MTFDTGSNKTDVCGCTGGEWGKMCVCHLALLELVAGHRFSVAFNYVPTAAVNSWKVPSDALQMQSVVLSTSLSVIAFV